MSDQSIRVQDEQGNVHVFPSEATPQMIAQALGVKPPASTALPAQLQSPVVKAAPPTPLTPEWFQKGGFKNSIYRDPWVREKFFNSADTATNAMPAAGATVGGIIGGSSGSAVPGAGTIAGGAIGAGIGGAGGEAGRQIVRRMLGFESPQTASDAAEQIGIEGVAQAALEASTMGLARGAKALAPKFAESALGVTETMRGRGRTIGQAALDQTTGVRPATIAKQASSQLGNLTSQMEGAVNAATQAGAVGTTNPAHLVLDNAIQNAPRNAKSLVQKLTDLKNVLELDPANPRRIYTPDELLEMKRGINAEMSSWPAEWQKMDAVRRVKTQLYGAIDGELDRIVPGNEAINQQISSLIPVKQRAVRIGDQATLPQRLAHRAAAHTGALASSGLGAVLGANEAKERGVNPGIGATAGALGGFILPEALTTPTAQMTMARMAGKAPQTAAAVLPFLRYLASQQMANNNNGQQ